jgi:hypothetical protein
MHTTKLLQTDDYRVTIDGREASFDELFPDLTIEDRFGFVLHTPGAALAISGLMTGVITRYYDFWRARSQAFWDYPDFYVFHVGGNVGVHGHLDIWPQHKEVVLPTLESEPILAAINDRAITRLIVEDGPVATRDFFKETLTPALDRVATAVAFSPDWDHAEADVTIESPSAVEDLVLSTVEASTTVPMEELARLSALRSARQSAGRTTELLRRIPIPVAIAMLTGVAEEPAPHYGMTDLYARVHGVDDVVMARHVTTLEPA